ncbi:MAG TPA: tetratricopeptide repeat protein [Polyangiaceae bacterium]|jgi:Flp pilus assembly protein TadD
MLTPLPMGFAVRHTTLWAAVALPLALAGCVHATAVDRAQTLVRQHREEDAVASLRKDLAAHPEDVPARRLLVRLLGFTGDMNAARAETEDLVARLGPDDPTPYVELGHALELAHRYDEALEAYDAAASAAPASPVGPREGGMRAARWGEAEWARPRLEEAVRRGGGDAETWHTLGLVRLHLGDEEGAEQAYRTGAAVEPTGPACWLGLATVAVVRGDGAAALAAYDKLMELRPRFAAGEMGRAWALAKLGRKDDAAKALDRAQELGAPEPQIARQRAALAAQGVPDVKVRE